MSKSMTVDEVEALRVAALDYYEQRRIILQLLMGLLVTLGSPPDDIKTEIASWLHAGDELGVRLGLKSAPTLPLGSQIGHA